ncbi:MAG: DUF4177 domain-containing protein [Gammaproteobacteria bacterium]
MRFEYKVMRIAERTAQRQMDSGALEQDLNAMGEQGWELVSMSIIGASTPIAAYVVLKRPKS